MSYAIPDDTRLKGVFTPMRFEATVEYHSRTDVLQRIVRAQRIEPSALTDEMAWAFWDSLPTMSDPRNPSLEACPADSAGPRDGDPESSPDPSHRS